MDNFINGILAFVLIVVIPNLTALTMDALFGNVMTVMQE